MSSFSLSGGVEVFGFISPSDTSDTYPVIDPLYGIDGLRNVDTITELNNIPILRRRAGMVVGVSGGTTYYKLNLPPWNNTITDWSIFNSGGSSGGTLSGDYLPLSGGTVSGGTEFTNGLTANTISASTYLNLPQDIFVTGGTYSAGTTTFTNNSGGTFNISGLISADTYVTGLTFNVSNYDLTIERNDGVSFTESLSILASDLTVTGGTYNPNTGDATFTNNTGGTFTVSGFLTGFTDTFVTGGTYSNGTATFTNSTGGTFNVTGFYTGETDNDRYITSYTYNNNTFFISDNSGSTYTATIDIMSGLTVNGNLTVTGTSTLDGAISSLSLTGSTDRLVQVNSGGTVTATTQIIDAYISSASTVATQLSNITNWDINGNYTGSTITGTFQGQKYYDNNYFYEAVQDNLFIRLIRG